MTSLEAKFRSFPNKPFAAAQKERLAYTSEHLKDRDETMNTLKYLNSDDQCKGVMP